MFSDLATTLNVAFALSCSMSPLVIPDGLESKWTCISDAQARSAATEDADQRSAEDAATWAFQEALIPHPSFRG